MSLISVRYTFFTLLIILASTFLHGKLIVQNEPKTIIKGLNSCLQRPEGVSYSPSGHCIAVACSSSNSISLYKRIGNAGIKYETSPYCVIQHSKLLHYAHDVDFSPCGQFLAVANRESNKVVIYKMNDLEKCTVNHIPHCILDSHSSHIDNPTSVSFSPCGEVLAVCSRKGRGITFYREIENMKGKYHPIPFYELTEEKLLEYGLSSPHGIAFSPDGKSIGIVHKAILQKH